MLQVIGRRSAFNVQKVMWLIGELDLPHDHIERGGAAGGLDSPEHLALNPHGRVPVIVDGETVVWESHAILRYLAAKFAPERFWHDDPAARARVDQWLEWSGYKLQRDFLTGVFWGYYRTPEAERDTEAVARAISAVGEDLTHLDRLLGENRFLLGEGLSLADISAGTNMYRYFNIDIERPDLNNVARWYGELTRRPAFQAHVMLPFEHMRGRLSY